MSTSQPTSSSTSQLPPHLICDKGTQFWSKKSQFWNHGFKQWCKRRGIKPRYGAVGQHGSIAIVERFIRTMKQEGTRRMFVSYCRKKFYNDLKIFLDWYNEHRPHTSRKGRTPNEVYHRRRPANQSPRFETRAQWPRPAPCAAPRTLVKGQPGVELTLDVRHHAGQKHLPIVTLRRAA